MMALIGDERLRFWSCRNRQCFRQIQVRRKKSSCDCVGPPWAFESDKFSKDSCTKAAFSRLPGYRGDLVALSNQEFLFSRTLESLSMRKPSLHTRQKGLLASLVQKRIFRTHERVFLTHQQVKIGNIYPHAQTRPQVGGQQTRHSASTCPKRRSLALKK